MRRLGVELLIGSSRLLLPAALVMHLLVVWSLAARGTIACLATLLAPGVAEAVWVVRLGWDSAPGQLVRAGGTCLLALLLLLGLGMALMSFKGSGRVPRNLAERV